jgi:hypothetical protein
LLAIAAMSFKRMMNHDFLRDDSTRKDEIMEDLYSNLQRQQLSKGILCRTGCLSFAPESYCHFNSGTKPSSLGKNIQTNPPLETFEL